MPFKSEAQRKLFYARPELQKYISEFETAKKLPKKRRARKNRH